MYLIYFDEVKDNTDTQKYFWVGGIAIESGYIKKIEQKLADISKKHFATPCLKESTEFHAADIYHKKRNYKSWKDPTQRISLIGELLRTLDDESIKKIYVKIDRNFFDSRFDFSDKKIDEMAFMLFCEKANELMAQTRDIGMLIGDHESNSIAARYAKRLSNWRAYGTEYSFGKEIKYLIDTVHFTESHLSRLLQLADIHIWCRQFRVLNKNTKDEIPKLMLKEMQKCGNAFFAKKYKEYPYGC